MTITNTSYFTTDRPTHLLPSITSLIQCQVNPQNYMIEPQVIQLLDAKSCSFECHATKAFVLQAATDVRKEVNELDNLTTGKAVDVLLNYETVKLFNNEQHEVDQYDAYLLGFQVTLCPGMLL